MLKTKACLYYFYRYSSFTSFWTIGTLAFTSVDWYILSSFYMCATVYCGVVGSLLKITNKFIFYFFVPI